MGNLLDGTPTMLISGTGPRESRSYTELQDDKSRQRQTDKWLKGSLHRGQFQHVDLVKCLVCGEIRKETYLLARGQVCIKVSEA